MIILVIIVIHPPPPCHGCDWGNNRALPDNDITII